jgi:hypothetical protein
LQEREEALEKMAKAAEEKASSAGITAEQRKAEAAALKKACMEVARANRLADTQRVQGAVQAAEAAVKAIPEDDRAQYFDVSRTQS